MKPLLSAVARLAASIKQNLLGNLEKLQALSAKRARQQLMLDIHTKIASERTPGAFGRPIRPHSRPQYRGNKLARVIANGGKVRGY